MRRLLGFPVTCEMLAALCQSNGRWCRVIGNVPDTARFLYNYFDDRSRSFICVFEDESFPMTPEGCPVMYGDRPMLEERGDELLAVAKELSECAEYWSEYDVPLGIVDRLRAAIEQAEAR